MFNQCLPIFLGPTIISRNRLILTDGAKNEYVPLILSTGTNASFPKTVHGLCYFHLCVIGWAKHVQPFVTKYMKEKDTIVKMVTQIKYWVKSWFYNNETNHEYLFSRHLFFLWLGSLRGVLSELFVDSVMSWIKSNLTPFERLWLNHKRLHVQGFNARTTSVGEGMHHSMKNGYDGVRANQTPTSSASAMMDKSMRICNNIEIFNAHELDRNRTQEHGNRGEYLTDHAYKLAEKQYILSQSQRAMRISKNEYCVYCPDYTKEKRTLIPAFYRLRRVKCINKHFWSCSCGLPSRMKLPCRHIMTIIGGYSIEMFSVRWLLTYQHGFQRKGFEKLTEVFRQIELSEFERKHDLGEIILVKDYRSLLPSLNFPITLGQTSSTDIDNMKMMIDAEINEKILVRGYTIEEQLNMREHTEQNGDGTVNIGLSQESETMFRDDYNFIKRLQEEQKNQCHEVMETKDAIAEEQVVILRETINAIDKDKNLLTEFTNELREMLNKYKTRCTKKQRLGSNNDIVFPNTGKCNKIYDKRKGHY